MVVRHLEGDKLLESSNQTLKNKYINEVHTSRYGIVYVYTLLFFVFLDCQVLTIIAEQPFTPCPLSTFLLEFMKYSAIYRAAACATIDSYDATCRLYRFHDT